MMGADGTPTRLTLVRHGETEGNVNQVWHGALDAPLTPRGELQVATTAARLAELHAAQPFDLFYVSPLPRAQSTAAVIATATGLTPMVEPDLREFELGDWEGRSLRELREVEKLWERWELDPAFAPPNGESPASFGRRVQATMARLTAAHPGQALLVVGHGGYISTLFATWLGRGPEDWAAFDPHNCAISQLVQTETGWYGELVNDIAHLPPAARVVTAPEY
jgi:probable phosphoglycerate mutase